MKTESKNKLKWGLPVTAVVPALLIILFEILKEQKLYIKKK